MLKAGLGKVEKVGKVEGRRRKCLKEGVGKVERGRNC
jgi:hypothetical protein